MNKLTKERTNKRMNERCTLTARYSTLFHNLFDFVLFSRQFLFEHLQILLFLLHFLPTLRLQILQHLRPLLFRDDAFDKQFRGDGRQHVDAVAELVVDHFRVDVVGHRVAQIRYSVDGGEDVRREKRLRQET